MLCSRRIRTGVLVSAMALPVLAVAGCAGTSSEVSALAKIAAGQMNTLTSNEVQALALAYCPTCQFTADQAGAVSQFLADNHIATIADLAGLIEKAIQDPASVVLPDGFLTLFQSFLTPAATQ